MLPQRTRIQTSEHAMEACAFSEGEKMLIPTFGRNSNDHHIFLLSRYVRSYILNNRVIIKNKRPGKPTNGVILLHNAQDLLGRIGWEVV